MNHMKTWVRFLTTTKVYSTIIYIIVYLPPFETNHIRSHLQASYIPIFKRPVVQSLILSVLACNISLTIERLFFFFTLESMKAKAMEIYIK